MVREHKGTIYTVCYMFSKDEEEVADLFQDILVNLWKGLRISAETAVQGHGYTVSALTPASPLTERRSVRARLYLWT